MNESKTPRTDAAEYDTGLGDPGQPHMVVPAEDARQTEKSLRERAEKAEAQLVAFREDAERCRYMLKHAAWPRYDDYDCIVINVPKGSDLSCYATRQSAIDAARRKP